MSAVERIAEVLERHAVHTEWGDYRVQCNCDGKWYDPEQHHSHVATAVVEALELTEEQRTLTDGWIQPLRNAAYYAQGLTPPPAVVTDERRWVSPWTEVARRVEQ